ncbi:Alpha/Beta hydrolase protein [Aspergillus unguis]
MIDHVLGRPSTRFRKVQVLAVFLFWSYYLSRGNKHGPPVLRRISSRLSKRLSVWQTTVAVVLWLYLCRNFAKIVGLECPEPLANLYSRSFFRATWITTALDAGFWTAMKVRPKWLRDIASLAGTVYYLFAAEQADDKVRRIRATLTVEHLRVSWNKGTTPYLWALAALVRPRLTRYSPRAIRIPRPRQSIYTEPTNAWLYFDGPLSALRDQDCIVLDIPGGGFVSMTPRHHEDRLLAWATKTKLPILSLNYKKAPEYPYPYALNECYDVYHSIITTRGRCLGLSGDAPPRIIMTGDSAGGNLAVGTTLMILQSGNRSQIQTLGQGQGSLPRPDGLVLPYPALNMKIESWMTEEQMALIQEKSTNRSVVQRKDMDYQRLTPFATPGASSDDINRNSYLSEPDLEPAKLIDEATELAVEEDRKEALDTQTAYLATSQPKKIQTRLAVSSMISYVNDRILSPEMMRAMVILYVGPYNRPDFNTDYLLSPILAPEELLAQFPKTYIITGERDPLVDDTVVFAGRLRQAKLRRFQERQELGLEKSHRTFNEKDHVEVSLLPGVSHGFLQMAGFFPDSWKHIHRCGAWLQTLVNIANMKQSTSRLGNSLSPSQALSSKSDTEKSPLRNHKRSLTGESSADEDKPLEMSIGKMTPLTPAIRSFSAPNNNNQAPTPVPEAEAEIDQSTATPSDSHLKPDEEHSISPSTSRARSTRPKGLGRRRPLAPTNINILPEWASDPVSPAPRRESSLYSLDSEEDLLRRRMSGLAGGLMGIGEGAQTP